MWHHTLFRADCRTVELSTVLMWLYLYSPVCFHDITYYNTLPSSNQPQCGERSRSVRITESSWMASKIVKGNVAYDSLFHQFLTICQSVPKMQLPVHVTHFLCFTSIPFDENVALSIYHGPYLCLPNTSSLFSHQATAHKSIPCYQRVYASPAMVVHVPAAPNSVSSACFGAVACSAWFWLINWPLLWVMCLWFYNLCLSFSVYLGPPSCFQGKH